MKKEIFCIIKHKNQKKLIESDNANNQKSQRKLIFKIIKKTKKIKISKWSNEEDQILLSLGQNAKRNKWKKCSLMLNNKTSYQCYLRFKKINPNIKKGRWTESEDRQLLVLVGIFGKSWSSIAKIMKNRSNKQIRNRYEEHICESLNKGLFSKEEDEKLIFLFNDFQKKWFQYKKHFKDRSIKQLKTRIIYLIQRKRIIKFRKNGHRINVNSKDETDKASNILLDNHFTAAESSKDTIISEESCENYNIKRTYENCQSFNCENDKKKLPIIKEKQNSDSEINESIKSEKIKINSNKENEQSKLSEYKNAPNNINTNVSVSFQIKIKEIGSDHIANDNNTHECNECKIAPVSKDKN